MYNVLHLINPLYFSQGRTLNLRFYGLHFANYAQLCQKKTKYLALPTYVVLHKEQP